MCSIRQAWSSAARTSYAQCPETMLRSGEREIFLVVQWLFFFGSGVCQPIKSRIIDYSFIAVTIDVW